MLAGRIRVELELEDGRFIQRVVRAGTTLNQLEAQMGKTIVAVNRLDQHHAKLGHTIRDLVVTVGLARAALENLHLVSTGLVAGLIKTNAEIERMTMLMKGMSKGANEAMKMTEAKESVKWLFDFAKQTPFEVKALTDSFVKLKAGGIDPMSGSLKALTDAVAYFGGDSQTLHRASIAIQQMAGKGVISMEELRQQLGEAVPTSMQMMARATGMNMKELVDKISKGAVEAKDALGRLTTQMALETMGAGRQMMTTWNGLMSQLATNWQVFQANIGGVMNGADQRGGFFDTMKQQVRDLLDLMESPAAAHFGKELGAGMADLVKVMREGLDWVIKYRVEIMEFGKVIATALGAQAVAGVLRSITAGIAGLAGQFRAGSADIVNKSGEITKGLNQMTAGGFGRAREGMNDFLGTSRMVMSDFIARSTAATGTTRAFAFAINGVAGAARVAAGAFNVFMAALGVVGAIATAAAMIWGLVEALGVFKDKAKESAEMWDRLKTGFANEDDLPKAKVELEALKQNVEAKKRLFDEAKKNRDAAMNPEGGVRDGQRIRETVRAYDDARLALNQAEADFAKKAETHARAVANHVAMESSRIAREAQTGVENAIGSAKAAFDSAMIDLDKKYEGKVGEKNQLARMKDNVTEAEKAYGPVLARLNADLDTWRGKLKSNDDVTRRSAETMVDSLTKRKEEITDLLARYRKSSDSTTTLMTGSAAAQKQAAKEADWLKSRYEGLDTAVKGLKAELAGESKELAKVNAELNDHAKAGTKYDKTIADRIRALAAEKDALTAQREAMKEMGEVMREVEKISSGLNVALEDSVQSLMDPTNQGYDNGYVRLQKQLDAKIAQARAIKGASADDVAAIEAEKARDLAKYRAKYVSDAAQTWREKSRDMAQATAETVTEQRALMTRAHEEELASAKRYLDEALANEALTTDQKRQIQENYVAYVTASHRKLARDSEGPMQKMLRGWSDMTAQMENATTRWLDNFVDQFAEAMVKGKMEWTSFAEMILMDLYKIIMRKQMAGMMEGLAGNLLSGFNSFIGNLFGPSTPTAGTGDGVPVPSSGHAVAHTGGLVGSLEGWVRGGVDPSMFVGAQKYHTGGRVGLASDEVPIVARKGEYIFTPEQMAALRGMGGSNVQVNVINQTGQAVSAQQQSQPRFDGERMILDIVLTAASRPGAFRDGLRAATA